MRRARWGASVLGFAFGGLLLVGFWRDSAFLKEHPAPGKTVAGVHLLDGGGAGRAVVFIHGNPGTALDFEPVMKALPELRCVAVDRPGYGWSARPQPKMTPREQAKAIHDAVVELKLSNPIVAGFSFGGPVAIAYALEFPSEVSGLVLLAAVGDAERGHPMHGAQGFLVKPFLGPLIAYGAGPWVAPGAIESGYATAFSPKPVDPLVVERGKVVFSRPGALLASAWDWEVLNGGELKALAAGYSKLALPVEALSAKEDLIVGPSHAKALAAGISGMNLVEVDGAGHQLMSTHTDEVVQAVRRAVSRAAQ